MSTRSIVDASVDRAVDGSDLVSGSANRENCTEPFSPRKVNRENEYNECDEVSLQYSQCMDI